MPGRGRYVAAVVSETERNGTLDYPSQGRPVELGEGGGVPVSAGAPCE